MVRSRMGKSARSREASMSSIGLILSSCCGCLALDVMESSEVFVHAEIGTRDTDDTDTREHSILITALFSSLIIPRLNKAAHVSPALPSKNFWAQKRGRYRLGVAQSRRPPVTGPLIWGQNGTRSVYELADNRTNRTIRGESSKPFSFVAQKIARSHLATEYYVALIFFSAASQPDRTISSTASAELSSKNGNDFFSSFEKSFRTKSAVSIRPGGRPTPTRTRR